MMLPEHCSVLREHSAGLEREENCYLPAHDEQLLEECQQILEQALAGSLELSFTVVTSSGREIITGVPLRFEQLSAAIVIDRGGSTLQKIDIGDIVSLKQV